MNYKFHKGPNNRTIYVETESPAKDVLESITGVDSVKVTGANIYSVELRSDADPNKLIRWITSALRGA